MLKIITDSASDMPQYIVERFNLHVIPTPVVIDGVDYLDGATIHTKEFYERQPRYQNLSHQSRYV